MSKQLSLISKVAKEQSLVAMRNKLKYSLEATPSRHSPNAAKLIDGAIQRASVQPARNQMSMTRNSEKVGMSRRPHQGVNSSGSAGMTTDPYTDFVKHQRKIARIYMPQRKHVHCHPADKTIGKYWAVDFETESTFKSPLMQWTSATNDAFYSKGDNL